MKQGRTVLLMLTLFLCSIASPPPALARDTGKETVAKAKSYAIESPVMVIIENADFATEYYEPYGLVPVANAGIITKTPTVEVKAFATVGSFGKMDQRYRYANIKNNNYSARKVFRDAIYHIDPGLRGC